MKKLTIWSNRDINPEDWKEDYKETAEINGWGEDTDDENNLWDYINDTLSMYLDDERQNLNIPIDGCVLVIADLGLWDGRKQGYQVRWNNVNAIFGPHYDYTEWYSDGYNIKAIDVHHDGVNYYEFREIRKGRNIQNLLDAIYNGEKITRKKLNYYTKSLHPYVAKVYGWK